MDKTGASLLLRYASLLGLILLSVYLLLVRAAVYLPLAVFWLAIFLVILALSYGSLLDDSGKSAWWVLAILFISVWWLKSILVPTTAPFFGSDAYYEIAATSEIDRLGWFALFPWSKGTSEWANATNYPLLSFVSLYFSSVSGLPLITWGRWGVLVLSLISLCLVYLISLEIFLKRKTALLGAIGFGTTYMYLMFHSVYVRESLAFIFFLGAIYSILRSQRSREPHKFYYRIAALVFSAATVFSHHLTSFLLFLFLFIWIVIQRVYPSFVKIIDRSQPARIRPFSSVVWLFLMVAMLAHWLYLKQSPLGIIHSLIQDAVSGPGAVSFSLPDTGRYTLLLILQVLTTLAFAILALLGAYLRPLKNPIHMTAIVWGGLLGAASLYLIFAGIQGTSSLSSRFELFAYAFLIPAAAHAIVSIYKKHRTIALSLCALFVFYGLNSVYRLPTYAYSQIQPDFIHREVKLSLLPEEYGVLKTVHSSGNIASDLVLRRLFKPLSNASSYDWFDLKRGEQLRNKKIDFDFIILGERQSILMEGGLYQVKLEDLGLSKVYQAGKVAVYIPESKDKSNFSIQELLQPERQAVIKGDYLRFPITAAAGLLLLSTFIYLICANFTTLFQLPPLDIVALGFPLIFVVVFLVYVIVDAINTEYTKIAITSVLFLILVIQLISLKRQKQRIRFNGWLLAFTLLLISLGFIADLITQRYNRPGYSEFYFQRLNISAGSVEIELKLANDHPTPVEYRFGNQAIRLGPGESWTTKLIRRIQDDPITFTVLEILPTEQTADYKLTLFVNESIR